MFINGLCKTLQRPTVVGKRVVGLLVSRYHTVQQSEISRHTIPVFIKPNIDLTSVTSAETGVTFAPRNISIDFNFPRNNNGIKNIIEFPILPNLQINDPQNIVTIKSDIIPDKSIELPTMENIIEKRAVRLIVIRRRKMKKHKLRKLRKRMKTFIIRLQQRRHLRKEKAFLAELLAQVKEAESFDAKKYVASRIEELTEVRIPKVWGGTVIPHFLAKQLIKEKEEKKAAKAALRDLTM